MTTTKEITVCDCGHAPSAHESITTGYGEDADGKTYCYDCCAARERKAMIETGKATLYLTKDKDGHYEITDWPGHLRFMPYHAREGRHNIARTRTDVWFTGPDGQTWHGVQYGEWTQIAHCRRVKA